MVDGRRKSLIRSRSFSHIIVNGVSIQQVLPPQPPAGLASSRVSAADCIGTALI